MRSPTFNIPWSVPIKYAKFGTQRSSLEAAHIGEYKDRCRKIRLPAFLIFLGSPTAHEQNSLRRHMLYVWRQASACVPLGDWSPFMSGPGGHNYIRPMVLYIRIDLYGDIKYREHLISSGKMRDATPSQNNQITAHTKESAVNGLSLEE